MTAEAKLEAKLWKALEADMTVMLGLVGREGGHTRPMTAQFEAAGGPIWFFTATDNALVQALGGEGSAAAKGLATFAAKGHDLFASIEGELTIDTDRAVVDRLWNRFVAAWYEEGKDDPKLALLRFDPSSAEIWESGSSLIAGIKLLLGVDPKEDYKDKVARVSL